jgi:hypothetical protein
VLRAFLDGQSHNRFSASSILRDTCLNSTVSELGSRGVVLSRAEEVVPGYQGAPTRCKRYWLDPSCRESAEALLARSERACGDREAA